MHYAQQHWQKYTNVSVMRAIAGIRIDYSYRWQNKYNIMWGIIDEKSGVGGTGALAWVVAPPLFSYLVAEMQLTTPQSTYSYI